MNKKIVTGLVLGLPVIAGLLIYFYWRQNTAKIISPDGSHPSGPANKETFVFNWTKWEDPAGFAFEYPEDATISSHPEDKTNYAYLTLSKNDKKGQVDILVNDSDYTNLDEWLKQDKSVKDKNSLETKIASASARRVSLGNGQEIAAFIDPDQVLYLIDLRADGETYWQEVYKHILDTFRLIPLAGETAESFSSWLEDFNTSGTDIVEPVEIIE